MIDEELEFKIEQLELMIKRWKRFYVLYRKILAREDVTAKDEREYSDLATYFARTYTPLATRCDLTTNRESDLVSMVSDAPDAQAIHEASDMQKRKFDHDWRVNNTAMNQKLGELQLTSEELQSISEFSYFFRRLLAKEAVQWCLGLSVVIVLLGVFGVFKMIHQWVLEFIARM